MCDKYLIFNSRSDTIVAGLLPEMLVALDLIDVVMFLIYLKPQARKKGLK